MAAVKSLIDHDCSKFCDFAIITYSSHFIETIFSLYVICCLGFSVLGALIKTQPFSSDSRFDDTSSALAMCLVPALLSLAAALITGRIYSLKLRHKTSVSVVLVAVLSIILCVYTGIVVNYALSNARRYEWNDYSIDRSDQYNALTVVSVLSSILAGLLSSVWLSVIYIPSVKLFGNPQFSEFFIRPYRIHNNL